MRRTGIIQLIIIFLLALIFDQGFILNTDAQTLSSEKEKAQNELLKLKSEREVFETQADDLMEEAYQTAQHLAELENQINQTNHRIQEIEKEAKEKKKKIENLENQRSMLLGDLYILTDNDLLFLMSLINTADFKQLISGKDEQSIIISEKIKEIIFIDTNLVELKEEVKKLALQKQGFQDEKINLAAKASEIQNQLQKAQKKLAGSDLRAFALEQFLLSLGKIKTKNDRDFIAWNKASGETYTFYGSGTEHGIGMSQYGVLGGVKHGISYVDNLTHYYTNTKVVSHPAANTDIRVGIVLGGSGGRINILGGRASVWNLTLHPGTWVDITPGDIAIFKSDGTLFGIRPTGGNIEIKPLDAQTTLEVTYKSSFFNRYKGIIRTINTGGKIVTINQVNMEEYLKGVVPGEMPSSWPVEALKAQAVAARSYAARQLKPGNLFDVDDSTRFQVYVGTGYGATESVSKAVNETKGQVIMYGSEIVPAYYHSTSGGWTENNENVWGGAPRPYLRGVSSKWEEESPWWSWRTKTFSRVELEAKFNARAESIIGELRSIEILNRGVSGRVLALRLEGSSGAKIISGPTFKSIINAGGDSPPLRCTLFGVKN